MTETAGETVVRIFTAPEAPCGTRMSWGSAAAFVRDRLRLRFGEAVLVEHIEVFSPRSFEFPAVLGAIERGAQLPIVLVGERIISQGGKLSESRIAQAVVSSRMATEIEPRRA